MTNRELDAAIAEKVMGEGRPTSLPDYCRVSNGRMWRCLAQTPYQWIPREFSTDPAASKQLEDRLHQLGWNIILRRPAEYGCAAEVYCNYGPCDLHGNTKHEGHGAEAKGPTTQSALALAALKVFGVETK